MERRALDQRAHPGQHPLRVLRDPAAEQGAAARRRPDQPEQHPDGGRLAGAVGPEEPVDRADRHREIDVVDGDLAAAEPLGQAGGGDRRRRRRLARRRRVRNRHRVSLQGHCAAASYSSSGATAPAEHPAVVGDQHREQRGLQQVPAPPVAAHRRQRADQRLQVRFPLTRTARRAVRPPVPMPLSGAGAASGVDPVAASLRQGGDQHRRPAGADHRRFAGRIHVDPGGVEVVLGPAAAASGELGTVALVQGDSVTVAPGGGVNWNCSAPGVSKLTWVKPTSKAGAAGTRRPDLHPQRDVLLGVDRDPDLADQRPAVLRGEHQLVGVPAGDGRGAVDGDRGARVDRGERLRRRPAAE